MILHFTKITFFMQIKFIWIGLAEKGDILNGKGGRVEDMEGY